MPYLGNKYTSTKLGIRINGKVEMRGAQEWVYKIFVGEVPKGYIIYHLDGNKFNNRVENLGIIKRSKLMQKQCTSVRKVEVQQIDELTGEVLAEYNALIKAAKANYTDSKVIREAARKERSAIGFLWKVSKEKSII